MTTTDAPSTTPPDRAARRQPSFGRALLLIVLCALGVRVAYVLAVTQYDNGFYDAAYYRFEAQSIVDGHGFVYPLYPSTKGGQATADHPPLTVLAFVPAAELPAKTATLVMRFEMVVLGTGVVVLIALLARELAGTRVGVLAGFLAALYPNLWMNDGLLMSETLAALTSVAAILLSYRLLRRPSLRTALGIGAVLALAALTREELALLVPVLALPAVWIATREWRQSVRLGGAVLAAAAVLVAPWIVFNLTRFNDPTFISTGDGIALLGANCGYSYHAPAIGFWNYKCLPAEPLRGDESVVSAGYRRRAVDYARAHAGELPVVVLARLGRLLGVYTPAQLARINSGEGRPEWATLAGIASFLFLVPFAVAGGVLLRRRSRRIWPLLTPVWLVLASGALVYGTPRFRVPAEPTVVVLAAVAITALAARRWPALAIDGPLTEPATRGERRGASPVPREASSAGGGGATGPAGPTR